MTSGKKANTRERERERERERVSSKDEYVCIRIQHYKVVYIRDMDSLHAVRMIKRITLVRVTRESSVQKEILEEVDDDGN